jgi:sulfatase maturation enzyme AslB (radical SAM superfamily)
MNKYEIHKLIPETMPENFCISPFQNTKQAPVTGRVSPCAYSSISWKMPNLTPEERWDNEQVNTRRLQSINNERPEAGCSRCWREEDSGKISLRQRQIKEYFPEDYEKFIKTGKWLSGPSNSSFKISNICNLACRTCFSLDSNYFNKEGKAYAELYGSTDRIHNIYLPGLSPPGHMDFTEYLPLVDNTVKFDFYGGEPMLNSTHYQLLEYLIEKGKSKNIHLYYSSNTTIPVSPKLLSLWEKFQQVGIGISIDGIGKQAEYLRWPCKWDEVEENVKNLIKIRDAGTFDCYVMGSYTVSTLNILQVDEMIDWYNNMLGPTGNIFSNIVNFPEHMTIRLLPDYVKDVIKSRINYPDAKNYLDVSPYSPLWWKRFIIWTKRMDLYRNQDFKETFPDMYEIIKDDWNKVTDLSEDNFHHADDM